VFLEREPPIFKCGGKLSFMRCAFRKQRFSPCCQVALNEAQERWERRERPCRHDVCCAGGNVLDPIREDVHANPGFRRGLTEECAFPLVGVDQGYGQIRAFIRREDSDDQPRKPTARAEVDPLAREWGRHVEELDRIRHMPAPRGVEVRSRDKVDLAAPALQQPDKDVESLPRFT
jgi:hypothetical protein